jgi:hypothetical protein
MPSIIRKLEVMDEEENSSSIGTSEDLSAVKGDEIDLSVRDFL